MEERLAKKDEIIYLLSHKISISNSQLSSHTKTSPWKPNENIADPKISKERSLVRDKDIMEYEIDTGDEIDETERIKSNLNKQLIEIRKNHKETYYKSYFNKISDSSLNSQNTNLDIDATEKRINSFKTESLNHNHKEVNNIKKNEYQKR